MKPREVEKHLDRQRRLYVFRVFRRHARRYIIPLWMSFSIVDYLYRPDLWQFWFALRLVCVAAWWSALPLLRISKIRQHSSWLVVVEGMIACGAINVMIWQTGGAFSHYVPGVILTAVATSAVFRLGRLHSTAMNLCCYGPTIAIFFLASDPGALRVSVVSTSLLIGMALLSAIFKDTTGNLETLLARAHVAAGRELKKARRSEFLKLHFPRGVREDVESGALDIYKRKILPSAVVGFADITGSTAMSNAMDLISDWDLKEKFLSAATSRATQSEMVVLTHTGDGSLFLANYRDGADWTYNLVSFYEGLQKDFEAILADVDQVADMESGIKCAVALGPAVMGFIGKDQSYFTVMGPTVNLAARLCGKAGRNEIVVSSRVWDVLKHIMIGWQPRAETHDLKGFSSSFQAMHISPRTSVKKHNICPDCGRTLAIVRTDEGFIDLRCPSCSDFDAEARDAA